MFVRTMASSFAVVMLMAGCAEAQYASPQGEVTFPDRTRVRVDIAATPELTARGLMYRREMGWNDGMVFVFDSEDIRPFWMKNTLIPLDIIWLDADRRVVFIAHAVPPCKADPCPSYPPSRPAKYVVEVNAGFAKKHGVTEGDTLVFRNIPLEPR